MFSRILPWLKFLRLPNVLTVPGDVLAGAALAGIPFSQTPGPVAAVCLAYLFGMTFNDLADLEEDRLHRPERPLPSGQIPLPQAKGLCLLLAGAALALLPTPGIVLLLACVTAYTLLKKHSPLAGGLLMASCRGLSLLIGAGFLRGLSPLFLKGLSPQILIAALMWFGFIFLVTRLAEREHLPESHTRLPWLIPLWLWLGFSWLEVYSPLPHVSAWAVAPGIFLLMLSLKPVMDIRRLGAVRPRHIGAFLSLLIPLQAGVLVLYEQKGFAVGLLLLYPLMKTAIKKIPAS